MTDVSANVARFSGFAALYDTHRPRPPEVLLSILKQLSGGARPGLVVDVGSGTGISTLVWVGWADAIVGVEPGADMRRQAEERVAALNDATIRFLEGQSSATGLPDACADIVTISQALHWMEPEPTFAEIARILRPGGVFAAYDCDWPPTLYWEAEIAYKTAWDHATEKEQTLGLSRDVRFWDKRRHLERIRASGLFRFTKEVCVHHVEQGNAERLVGILLSQGGVATLLKHGLSEDEIGVTALREVAQRALGDDMQPWYWTYRVRLGIK